MVTVATRIVHLVAASAGLASVACGAATPEAKYGDTARYSAHYRSYVITRADLVEPPVLAADVLVLRDPLDGRKIRCREQLADWLEPQARAAGAGVRSQYAAQRSPWIMFPFAVAAGPPVVAGGVLVAVGGLLWLTAEVPYFAADYPSARSLYHAGVVAFREGEYAKAREALETSMFMDSRLAVTSYLFSYLGFSYEQLHEDDLARRAFTSFVERSTMVNASAYQSAEDRLARLGAAIPKCQSTDPVEVPWGLSPGSARSR